MKIDKWGIKKIAKVVGCEIRASWKLLREFCFAKLVSNLLRCKCLFEKITKKQEALARVLCKLEVCAKPDSKAEPCGTRGVLKNYEKLGAEIRTVFAKIFLKSEMERFVKVVCSKIRIRLLSL